MLKVAGRSSHWELVILDAAPPSRLESLTAGDVDGDGRAEIINGVCPERDPEDGGLLWHRPSTAEKGRIPGSEGRTFGVGLTLGDIDGDGRLELIACESRPLAITWYKHHHGAWARHILDPEPAGVAHDIIVVDVDGDGTPEIVTNAIGGDPGVSFYKAGADVRASWTKYVVQRGYFEEGLLAADLDGDGRVEVASGPNVYIPPEDGPAAGAWVRREVAPHFRQMCRVAALDITGSGSLDLILIESEYMDGQLSWFENRMYDAARSPWLEHPIDQGLVYGHSLEAWRNPTTQEVHLLVGEMNQGGFSAPQNRQARLTEYSAADKGRQWRREIVYRGEGTHEAMFCDLDGDGIPELAGHQYRNNRDYPSPKVHYWRQRQEPSVFSAYRHRFLDRDKPYRTMAILAADIDADGKEDVVCGSWWYRNPTWQRCTIAEGYQVLNAWDLDGDGRQELIAVQRDDGAETSRFFWLKALDPANGEWESHYIGRGGGTWPRATIAPFFADGGLGLAVAYRDSQGAGAFPDLFRLPDRGPGEPWVRKPLTEIAYGQELFAFDLNGNGMRDIVAGGFWLENLGDGSFHPHRFAQEEGFEAARVRAADINGNGRPDIVVAEGRIYGSDAITPTIQEGGPVRPVIPPSRLAWFEAPADPRESDWPLHVIDVVKCPHSLDVADLDGDGEPEIICAQHDPYWPLRGGGKLTVYKQADPGGRTWSCHHLDQRFSHYCGAQTLELGPGRVGIVSHDLREKTYVHLWEPGT